VARFLGKLCADEIGICNGRMIHKFTRNLVWLNGCKVAILPFGMEVDLASVPRLPIIFMMWGDRAHRPAALHDGTYRKDFFIYVFKTEEEASAFAQAAHDAAISIPDAPNAEKQPVAKEDGDWYFREAMIGNGEPWRVYHWMWMGVRLGGSSSYHRMNVMDRFPIEREG